MGKFNQRPLHDQALNGYSRNELTMNSLIPPPIVTTLHSRSPSAAILHHDFANDDASTAADSRSVNNLKSSPINLKRGKDGEQVPSSHFNTKASQSHFLSENLRSLLVHKANYNRRGGKGASTGGLESMIQSPSHVATHEDVNQQSHLPQMDVSSSPRGISSMYETVSLRAPPDLPLASSTMNTYDHRNPLSLGAHHHLHNDTAPECSVDALDEKDQYSDDDDDCSQYDNISSRQSNNRKRRRRSDDSSSISSNFLASQSTTKEQSILRAKIRNRDNARKNRLKKKHYIATLEEQVAKLQDLVDLYREVIVANLGGEAISQAIADIETSGFIPRGGGMNCSSAVETPSNSNCGAGAINRMDVDDCVEDELALSLQELLEEGKESNETATKGDSMLHCLQNSESGIVITNPNLPGEPIIFCDSGFEKLTGYNKADILGRNARVLQGPEELLDCVTRATKERMKQSLEAGGDSSGVWCVKNYKKDGTPFMNYVNVRSLTNIDGDVLMRVGVMHKVNDEATATAQNNITVR